MDVKNVAEAQCLRRLYSDTRQSLPGMIQTLPAPEPLLFIGKLLINGTWKDSSSGERFNVENPDTGAIIGSCPEGCAGDVEEAIAAASAALPSWRGRSGRQRSRIIRRLFELVLESKDDLARIISLENGKSSPDAMGEVMFTASFFEWYAEEAARIYGDVIPHSAPDTNVVVAREAIGVCGLITPFVFFPSFF